MNTLTLRQMRYFSALARHRHFGRAAAACAISQPALSMQIRALEAALGTPLIERGGRGGLRLTGLGEEVAARVRVILREVEGLGELARATADGGLAGRLRLGVIPTIAPYLLPGVLGALAARHPGLAVQPRESLTATLIGELEDGALDAAILALPVSEPALVETPLFEEEFVLVRPAADAGRPVPRPAELQALRLLLLEEGHCFRDQALAVCNLAPGRPREILDGSTLATLVQMVAAGIGATLIPQIAVPVETRSAEVAIDRFAPPRPLRRVGMVWRRGTPLAAGLRGIAATVRAAAGPGTGTGPGPGQAEGAISVEAPAPPGRRWPPSP